MKITQTDHDNLADIAWFIKGLRFANDNSPFGEYHEESLRKVMSHLRDMLSDTKMKYDSDDRKDAPIKNQI